MSYDYFHNLFADLALPVVVCTNTDKFPVVYMNVKASLLIAPLESVQRLQGKTEQKTLRDILRFESRRDYDVFEMTVRGMGHVDQYAADIKTFNEKFLPVFVSGKDLTVERENDHVVFYMVETNGSSDGEAWLSTISGAMMLSDNVEDSIEIIMDFMGRRLGVSRVYIFEEISETATSNTYEWCAPGIRPAIQDLQEVKKADYNYDTLVRSGMYVTNDVTALPKGDQQILEGQGIKALAMLTIYDNEKPVGYVGVDDCASCRKWNDEEVRLLRTASSLLSLMIKRRNAERGIKNSLEILQLMSDSSDEVVYVNSLTDYRLMFVSKALCESLGRKPEELLGKECWKVLQKDQTGPCSFCPIPKIKMADADAERSEMYVWENENTLIGKSYLIKDSIVKWIDGQNVHIETAIDISDRIEYEDKLRYLASMDRMTGVYNREWGASALEKKLKDKNTAGSLCFLDADGLKRTNDLFGHSVGDELLSEIARIVRGNISDKDFICRWGGDEFLIWMDAPLEKAERTLLEIQREMDAINATRERNYPLSFSYGIVPFESGKGMTLDAMVTACDALMYQNKMTKRGLVQRRRRSD